MTDRGPLVILARRFPSRAQTEAARERVYEHMKARIDDPRAADPPPLTIGVGLDADSADGFLVFIAPREFGPETEVMARLAGGEAMPREEVPPEFVTGLLVRRATMAAQGELTRFDSRRPSTLRPDGTLEEW